MGVILIWNFGWPYRNMNDLELESTPNFLLRMLQLRRNISNPELQDMPAEEFRQLGVKHINWPAVFLSIY